jgi:hypothetical protein
MNKDTYQISRKAEFILLTILLHDLTCFDKELQESISDKDSLIRKFRITRNVFVSLHNLKDSLNRIRVSRDEEFISKTRALRRELELITHIRNKGVGHLDRNLLERAAQWMPQIFNEGTKFNEDYIVFECYRAIMEASVNSYLNESGEQKNFSTEIDFLYPPDAKLFYEFLSRTVNDSMDWLSQAREIVKSEIDFYQNDKIKELAFVAANTNFNLNAESNYKFNEDEMKARTLSVIEMMREIGADERVIGYIQKEVLKS